MEINELRQAFKKAYSHEATAVYFSPGRVNLIGEHTDYNGGHVFPCALSFGTYLLLAPNQAGENRFVSLNVDGEDWKKYPKNVLKEIEKLPNSPIHPLTDSPTFDFLYWGNVPAGAGLSSSAAIEVVTAFAIDDQLNLGLSRTQMALISQAAEHACGVNCGIMDQFASAQGKRDHAINLDCATLEYELVPVALKGMKVVIANTHSPHKLDSGAYNARVAQCQEALQQIREIGNGKWENLAQVSQADFDRIADQMTDPVAKRRARHVVGEVARTNEAIAALKQGDIARFGQLMNQSHVSLRDDYEVTGPELDALAEAAWQVEGVVGSRMTGGGFGGCTVSIVRDEAIDTFIAKVGKQYTEKTGLKADFYIAEIGDGARKIGD